MWFWSTGTFRVLVSAKPCGVVVGYVSQGRLGEYWPCSLNRLGGYACPETGFRKRRGSPRLLVAGTRSYGRAGRSCWTDRRVVASPIGGPSG